MWRHLKTVITLCSSDTFMAHELYSDFPIQNTFMSTVVLVNEVSWGIATSLSHKCYSANVPLDFCTTADFDIKYFSTKALLAFRVIPNWFSTFCRQNGYLNSKLMLRRDSHFKIKDMRRFLRGNTRYFSDGETDSSRKKIRSKCFSTRDTRWLSQLKSHVKMVHAPVYISRKVRKFRTDNSICETNGSFL